MWDGASTNNVAMRTLNVLYCNIFDVTCFSHTLDCVGNHFQVPILLEFINGWVSLFSHSSKVKLLWKVKTGKAMALYSQTRWWSKWEVMAQAFKYFGDIEPFLTQNADFSPATQAKLLAFFYPNKNIILQIELAAIVDWGEPFVKATYRLEGDGALAFECFEVIDTIRAFIQSGTTPNNYIQALADRLSCGVLSKRQLVLDHVHNCVKPAIDYFNLQLASTLNRTLSGFKAARFFYP